MVMYFCGDGIAIIVSGGGAVSGGGGSVLTVVGFSSTFPPIDWNMLSYCIGRTDHLNLKLLPPNHESIY